MCGSEGGGLLLEPLLLQLASLLPSKP